MFLFILLLALMFLVGIYLVDHALPEVGYVWLALSVLLGIAVYEVPRRQTRRALKSNPSAQGEIVLIVNQRGVVSTFLTGKSELEWRAFTKYKETERIFLLSTGIRSSFIPKRAMSAEQVRELRNLLTENIPERSPASGNS
ncbi:MAG TPA: YcxB family protein [Terriglobales bacterium]|nr:YcxB family protein [Terriglobales bacterium]